MADIDGGGAETLHTARTQVRRSPRRGAYDRDSVGAVLDAGVLCHVAILDSGAPISIPMVYGRIDDRLFLHGALGSRLLRRLREGLEACISVTLLDGLVISRSVFNHTVNYRSLMMLGTAQAVPDGPDKLDGLRAIIDHVCPGSWDYARGPTADELNRTMLIEFPIREASVKHRSAPPPDEDDGDHRLPLWGGVVPVVETFLPAESDSFVPADMPIPQHVLSLVARGTTANGRATS